MSKDKVVKLEVSVDNSKVENSVAWRCMNCVHAPTMIKTIATSELEWNVKAFLILENREDVCPKFIQSIEHESPISEGTPVWGYPLHCVHFTKPKPGDQNRHQGHNCVCGKGHTKTLQTQPLYALHRVLF